MELWRVEERRYGERPKVLGVRNLAIALGLHLAFFVVFFTYAAVKGLFDKKEEIIPIDLTVVVVENLNGNEDEPPPLKKPEPPPPPPKPKPKPKNRSSSGTRGKPASWPASKKSTVSPRARCTSSISSS